jgi:hypothetical protein
MPTGSDITTRNPDTKMSELTTDKPTWAAMHPQVFRDQLRNLINYHSKENGSNTPDFILADYLEGCLAVFDKTMIARDAWRDPHVSEQPIDVTGIVAY